MSKSELPRVLFELIESGRWHQPSDAVVRELVPIDELPFDFRLTPDMLGMNGLSHLLKHRKLREQFHVYRSGWFRKAKPLPWIDVWKAIVIAEGRMHGSDSGIVLDLRTSTEDPAVLASNWEVVPGRCRWEVISPALSIFMSAIESCEKRLSHA